MGLSARSTRPSKPMAMTVRRLSLTNSGPASSAECAVTAHGIAPDWAVTAHSAATYSDTDNELGKPSRG